MNKEFKGKKFFKEICFIFLLFVYQNIQASHEPCIAVYPTPPECLHDEDNDNKNIILAGVILAGALFYLNKNNDAESFDINAGFAIYEGEKVKLSLLSNRFYQQTKDINYLSTIYPFYDLEHYQNHNILSINWNP